MFYYNTCLYLRADICIMLLTVPILLSIYDVYGLRLFSIQIHGYFYMCGV